MRTHVCILICHCTARASGLTFVENYFEFSSKLSENTVKILFIRGNRANSVINILYESSARKKKQKKESFSMPHLKRIVGVWVGVSFSDVFIS